MATMEKQLTPEEFFKLSQEERLKVVMREVPLKVKVPFFTIGVLGILANCLTSAFAGTSIYTLILEYGYTDFWARFLSLAFALFSLHLLNEGLNRTGRWFMNVLYGNR